jgi:predicted nucleotidyltransferase component of viral defense system
MTFMDLDRIKKTTVKALMHDEKLMYGLVLKGGNALQLVYEITDRASMDIDFSMQGDFSTTEIQRLSSTFEVLLNEQFQYENHRVFDVKFFEKPKQGKIKEWKGYTLQFKITHNDRYFIDNIDKTRREAVKVLDQSTIFSVDISSFEYISSATKVELDGTVLMVYTPEMIILEKLRALCQSIPEYKEIVSSANVKGRARDFYDIWNICQYYEIDFTSNENKKLLKEIFSAKRVPVDFLNLIPNYKDLQKENWNSVEDTLSSDNNGFDFYYDFVIDAIQKIKSH